jgi:hypothetical protein
MLSAAALFALIPALRVVEIEVVPTGRPQMAIWLEDVDGRFVDTIMVTRLVGTYGLGNRPGRGDFGTGYLWPYGRREMALPIWAHRRGVTYDRLVFQDCHENAIRYHNPISSTDRFYCRPTTPEEHAIDALTCPTARFASCKGMPLRLIDPGASEECAALVRTLEPTSVYPPRNDVAEALAGFDWDGVAGFEASNELDAVSTATPIGNAVYRATYALPEILAPGIYVVWIEVSVEGDFNGSYDFDFFHDPVEPEYGIPFLGQPSIAWRVEIPIDGQPHEAFADAYAGYGSLDGSDGDLRPPDATITTGVPGSGAERLLPIPGVGRRVRARVDPEASCEAPPPIEDLAVAAVSDASVEVTFGAVPPASSYEVRYREGIDAIPDEAAFALAIRAAVPPVEAGTVHVRVDQLQRSTPYTIAVRSLSACGIASELRTAGARTTARTTPPVDACFIATAAYGSKDEPHVAELRRFRDRVLLPSPLGRRAVDLYYAVSPPIADLIREDEAARSAVRLALDPIVSILRE